MRKQFLSFSELYLNPDDRRILDFYYANLELRFGTILKNIALSSFASPMTNTFGSHHYASKFEKREVEFAVQRLKNALFNDMLMPRALSLSLRG